MSDFRALARRLFYRYPFTIPIAGVVSFFAITAAVCLRLPSPMLLMGIAGFGIVLFIWGYSAHALKNVRYPSLDHLHRRNYAEVWDTLAATPVEARNAACGTHSEDAILESAATPVRNIIELGIVQKDDDLLEIGCGVGRIGLELASRCRSWTGADISQNMLREAGQRLRELSNARLVRLERVGLDSFEAESFNLVYSTNMFDHLDEMDRWLYIRDAFRVLRLGGRLYVDNVDIESQRGWEAFARGADVLGDFKRPAFQPRPTTGAEMTVFARRAGFHNVRTYSRDPLVILVAEKT